MKLIITHKSCDFDALASSAAAARLYPGSRILLPETLKANVRAFVNLYRDLLPIYEGKDPTGPLELVVVVDTKRRERLGKWAPCLDRASRVVLYDHHPEKGDLVADETVTELVGATTTIILEEMKKKKISLGTMEANLYALGIYEDTGCLTFNITTARDVNVLAYLWSHGLNPGLLQEYLRNPLSESQKTLLEKLIQSSDLLELNQRRVLISAAVVEEYVLGAAVLIRLLDEIEDAGLTVIIVQMSTSIYLAARSRDSDLNLLDLLAPLGVKGYPGSVTAHLREGDAWGIRAEVIDLLARSLPPVVTASAVCSSPVFTVDAATTVAEADELLAARGFKGCPVIEEGRLVGVISRRDLHKGLRNTLGHAPVKGFMARNPVTALPDDPLVSVRRVMVEQNIGRVPIIGKDGKLTGIITRTDILRHLDLPEPLSPAPSTGTLRRSNNNTALSLENLQPLLREGLHPRAQKILNQARHLADREKTEIYLVGGTIRDLLLGYPPEKDLDLVVIGDAPAFTEKLRQVLGGRSRIHAQFGTASLSFEDGLHLDLVTAREEFYDAPAALPRVESAGLKKDLFRRDFSINTMACSLAADDYGRLIDFFNGRRDLHKGRIRSLYRLSFVDDPLRILRAVRFEQRFRFNIEPETMSLIGQAVKDRLLERVNRQRLNSELRLIYREPSPLANLQRCSELSMLPQLYPGIDPGPENWRLLQHLEETLERVDNKGWFESLDRELVYLSGLLHGLDYTARSAIIIKLNLSRERAFNLETSGSRSLFILEQLRKENLGPSAVVEALEGQSPETVLLAMTLAAEKAVRERIRTYLDSLRHIQPQITGKDLKALGLEPGPRYQEVLGLLRKAVLEGMVCSRQEERDFVSGYLDAPRGKEEL